jgi:hypothetical protein
MASRSDALSAVFTTLWAHTGEHRERYYATNSGQFQGRDSLLAPATRVRSRVVCGCSHSEGGHRIERTKFRMSSASRSGASIGAK